MHWSMIVWLMYLWRTRTSGIYSAYMSKPACTNCRFFLPPTDDIHRTSNVRMGKCLLYPYSNQTVATLVAGMSEPNYGGNFHYAIVARTAETMCGHYGTQFSAKKIPQSFSPFRTK